MKTNYTELIERYFDNQLSSEEVELVEQLKKVDSDFQEEFKLFEKSHQVVKLSTLLDLKEDIKSVHKQIDESNTFAVISAWWVGIAASTILFVMLGVYAQRYSNESLYAEAFTPIDDYITNMDNTVSEMEKAMDLLDQEQYDSASIAFHKIYKTTGSQVAIFYEGTCFYQANKLEEAIMSWNKISNDYQPEAQWYVALAYLKMDDIDNTIQTLNAIIDNNKDEKFVLKAQKLKTKLLSPFRKLVF